MTARVDTLDALDSLQTLRDADELKSKLLFSVVVVRNIEDFCEKQIFINVIINFIAGVPFSSTLLT